MRTNHKELHMLLVEVDETLQEIEKDIRAFSYHKDKLGAEYYATAVELRARLLNGYALKAELIKALYNA